MNVLFIAPGYPDEMPYFVRGLARVGANVHGLADQPRAAMPEMTRKCLSGHVHVRSLWDEDAVIESVRAQLRGVELDQIECLWEPAMGLAARLRETFRIPGMGVEQTQLFRDKDRMKLALAKAGVRVPRHRRARTEREVRAAAEALGYPLIIKPVSGAGSADTHRIDDDASLEQALHSIKHVAEVSVEEFIEGDEYTFDTISVQGQPQYQNVCLYRPRALIGRSVHWISPQTIALRNIEHPDLACGIELGHQVIDVLGFQTGFTHMEWFRTPAGEAVFIEIAARPPGARTVEVMNYASDIDVFTGWAEAACHQRFTQDVARKYNAVVTFKRANGPLDGHITRIEGLGALLARYGSSIVDVSLLPIGARRRNWKSTLLSDGYVIARHADLETTKSIADRIGTDLQLYAS